MENVRGLGLVRAGPLRLKGVRGGASRDGRYADDDYPLQAGLTVTRAAWGADHLLLWCVKETGPGDADTPEFRIGFAAVSDGLRSSVARSLLALAGSYPGWAHRRRRLPGDGRVTMAALRDPH